MYPAEQLPHDALPEMLNCPGPHAVCVGADDADEQAYPALQLLHVLQPACEYWPAGHTTSVAFGDAVLGQ